MTSITSNLIIQLVEKVSGPARTAAHAITGVGQALAFVKGKALNGLMGDVRASMQAQQAHLDRMRGRLLEAAAMGTGLYASLKAPIDLSRQFESALLDIGQKADLTDEQIRGLGTSIRNLGPSLNQTSLETAKGVDFLAGMGLDPDKALTLMKPIGKAATAYKAEVEDLAKAGFAALDNLKLQPEEFSKALDAMAQSGKEGAFELRDMAQYFPSLTASAQAFGMKGVKAVSDLSAALQIARKGAGDSAEAANNVANLLQKIVALDAVKKFKKVGIDIRAELKKTQAAGGSPIEMVAELTNKATKGDLTKVSDFFEDAQVQKALRPLIQNLEEYRRIRAKASQVDGVVDDDFARRLQTNEAQLKQFTVRLQELGLSVGGLLLPPLNELLGVMTKGIHVIQNVAQSFPKLTQAAILAGSGLIGLRVAVMGLGFVASFMKMSLLSATYGLMRFGQVVGGITLTPLRLGLSALSSNFAACLPSIRAFTLAFMLSPLSAFKSMLSSLGLGLLSLLNPLNLVKNALSLLRVALIGTGIGAILIGIALAGAWIAKNWQGITIAFEAFKGAFMSAIAPVMPILNPIINLFTRVKSGISAIIGPLNVSAGTWARWGAACGQALGRVIVGVAQCIAAIASFVTQAGAALEAFLSQLAGLASQITSTLASAVSAFFEAGSKWIQSLWDGMVSKFTQFLGWVKTIPSQIVGSIKSIDLSGMIKWPSFLGGGGKSDGKEVAGTRASGGPVASGCTYLVGEKGPELFTASSHGRIIPNEALQSAAQAMGSSGNSSSSQPARSMSVNWSGNVIVQGSASAQDADSIAAQVFDKLNELARSGYKTLYADIGQA